MGGHALAVGVEGLAMVVAQVESGEEGEAGRALPHVQRNPYVPGGCAAVRRQQPLLCHAVLQGGMWVGGVAEQGGAEQGRRGGG